MLHDTRKCYSFVQCSTKVTETYESAFKCHTTFAYFLQDNCAGNRSRVSTPKRLIGTHVGTRCSTTVLHLLQSGNVIWRVFTFNIISRFVGGKLNVCYNAVDRHVNGEKRDTTAVIYDSPVTGQKQHYSYARLHYMVRDNGKVH